MFAIRCYCPAIVLVFFSFQKCCKPFPTLFRKNQLCLHLKISFAVFDVVDIVALANCVLAANCNDGENGCVSDLDGDGFWNIIDIVALVNCVLYENCI